MDNKRTEPKPQFLYHGSPNRIEQLEPRTKPHREKEEGKLVYATSELTDAIMFLQRTAMTGQFLVRGEKVVYAIIVSNREEFIEKDIGGYLHILPSKTFEPSPYKGMPNEWVSKDAVQPTEVIKYLSALDTMIENGIQVYFVDQDMLQQIRDTVDHGYDIFKKLESENKRRGVNIKF